MKAVGVKVGVGTGLLLAPILVLPMLDLFLGHCFYEEGCGRHESFLLLGVVLAACATAGITGWVVAFVISLYVERRQG